MIRLPHVSPSRTLPRLVPVCTDDYYRTPECQNCTRVSNFRGQLSGPTFSSVPGEPTCCLTDQQGFWGWFLPFSLWNGTSYLFFGQSLTTALPESIPVDAIRSATPPQINAPLALPWDVAKCCCPSLPSFLGMRHRAAAAFCASTIGTSYYIYILFKKKI